MATPYLDAWLLRPWREGMRRASNPVVWLSVLLAAAAAVLAPDARAAMICESARPTDPAGSAGVSYGSAKVSFYDAASGHARVHYALSGPHAPPLASTLEAGVPDAVVVAAQAAEDALVKFSELSYVAPLDDGDSPCASNGDSDAVDIYLLHFAAADGQTVLDHCQEGAPRRCAGFVLVENDFRGGGYADVAEGMRTVVPHELFHLVQDAYDADVERWWAEGSAQWAAKQVYPDLQDLERFLPAYFDNPWRPLNVPPNGVITDFLYATAIWPVFLQQRFDSSIVREIYEGFGQGPDGVLPTTDVVLQAHDSTLAQEFLQFAAYNATTGGRGTDTAGYTEGASYPVVPIKTLDATTDPLVSDIDSGLGAYYYSLRPEAPLKVELDADPARMTGLLIPLVDGKLDLAAAQPLPATVDGEAALVVASQSLLRTDAPFSLRGVTPGGSQAGTKGDAGPESSGCSIGPGARKNAANSGAAFGFVVILLGRCRARRKPRKGR